MFKPTAEYLKLVLDKAADSMNGLRLHCTPARRWQQFLYMTRKNLADQRHSELVFYVPPGSRTEVWIINPRGLIEAANMEDPLAQPRPGPAEGHDPTA